VLRAPVLRVSLQQLIMQSLKRKRVKCGFDRKEKYGLDDLKIMLSKMSGAK